MVRTEYVPLTWDLVSLLTKRVVVTLIRNPLSEVGVGSILLCQ